MNPNDALQQDWRMYYNGAWMRHKRYGPVQVVVMDDCLFIYRWKGGQQENEPTQVRASELECWWPRSGSYNVPGKAIYIARMATRSMRKSAHPNEHYRITYGSVGMAYGAPNIMVSLREGPKLVDVDFAKKVLEDHISNSVAVSHDIILERTPHGSTNVVFRGITTGELEGGTYTPAWSGAAISRRVESRLISEGVI